MRIGFYPKLAWTGIKKNKRLYLPYILTCIGMVMMFYIITFLNTSDILDHMTGGGMMRETLGFGVGVIGVFALIFLFYTNSFLTKRRKKEFGLYNILGMDKRNISVVLLFESVIITAFALVGGLFAGITFSKLTEALLVNIMKSDVDYSFKLSTDAIALTLGVFAVIFILLFLNMLRQIHLTNPIELLHSSSAGEKQPKANWLLALAGSVILAVAYYIAITIEDPASALVYFFVAVIMVIIGTYLIFIAGSVVVCKLLQKNKKYYYKTNHFISVSSMIYRMKRNGAGLASICILLTMVLVMLSSTTCLYVGMEDAMRMRYPRNINMQMTAGELEAFDSDEAEIMKAIPAEIIKAKGQTPKNVLNYRAAYISGFVQDDTVIIENQSQLSTSDMTKMAQIFFISLDDYNALMGENKTLQNNECLIYKSKSKFKDSSITIDGKTMQVKEVVSDFIDNGEDTMSVMPTLYIFVPHFEETVHSIHPPNNASGVSGVRVNWYYAFDLDCGDEEQVEIKNQLADQLEAVQSEKLQYSVEAVAEERESFFALYGGLFFLGILLSLVFIIAAVLIIYYKQISEGYEDQSRFEIMQKVGMTKREIKKSINSQVLTVFFLPLIMAGAHLSFAFPMIYRMMIVLAMDNLKLLILVTIACFLIAAAFYTLIYKITSKAYYSIVSGARE